MTRSTEPCQAEFPDYSEAHSSIPRDEAGQGIPKALGENSRQNKGLMSADNDFGIAILFQARWKGGERGKASLFPEALLQVSMDK